MANHTLKKMKNGKKRVADEQLAVAPKRTRSVYGKKQKVKDDESDEDYEGSDTGDVYPSPKGPLVGQNKKGKTVSVPADELTTDGPVITGAIDTANSAAEDEILAALHGDDDEVLLDVLAEAGVEEEPLPVTEEQIAELRATAVKMNLPADILDNVTGITELLDYSDVREDDRSAIEKFVAESVNPSSYLWVGTNRWQCPRESGLRPVSAVAERRDRVHR